MTYTTRRAIWYLALIDDRQAHRGDLEREHRTSLLVVRPDATRLVGLGDFGNQCPWGAACAVVRALIAHRRDRSRPGTLRLHDARLARRVTRAVRSGGTSVRLHSAWPTLDEARASLPGGVARWRWTDGQERPRPSEDCYDRRAAA